MFALLRRTIRQPSLPGIPFKPSPAFVGLILLCGSVFLQGIQSRDLWASHEARAAQNAQGILDDGNWLLPRLFDVQVELQKPPAFYWMVAAIGWLRGGVDSWAVRLPAVIAGTLTVLMVWWHLHKRGRPVAGFLAGAMLAGAVHFTGTARIGRIDVPLACVIAAIMMISRVVMDKMRRRPKRSEGDAVLPCDGV
ncbi:MAG TPA: glycosyltransferase family 39 protein, partial [Gemmataceae bacterium]|nr:glycosyltransferase family 39 protein [Gemmataceae bacterium]